MKNLFYCLFLIFIPLATMAQGTITRPQKSSTATSKKNTNATKKPSISKNDAVTISDPDGFINGYGYVDLGLPSGLKWAYSNIGASSPTDDGDRYARGEVTPKKSFTAENYEFVTVEDDGTLFYNKYPNPYQDDLDLNHDAAHHSRGATWRIPSAKEWKELCDNCDIHRGRKGMLLTSRNNGKSIFLPLAPVMYENGRTAINSGGYWSSSSGGNSGALGFSFSRNYHYGGCSSTNATLGHVIRAVAE